MFILIILLHAYFETYSKYILNISRYDDINWNISLFKYIDNHMNNTEKELQQISSMEFHFLFYSIYVQCMLIKLSHALFSTSYFKSKK